MAASTLSKVSVLMQKYRTPLLLLSCGGVFSANILKHLFPEETFRKMYQAWSQGEPASLSGKLQQTFAEVLEDTGVHSPGNYSAFAAFGFHPVGAGVPWLPSGAQIGIPANFNSSAEDSAGITNRTIFINGKGVAWDSAVGTALKEALVFSPEAQRFAIAREVMRLEGGGPVLHAVVAPSCLAGVWLYATALKQIFFLHTGPALLRGVANSVALGLGAISYFLTADALNQWQDYSCDRRAAGLSARYAKGGVEFYDKILSRNKSLRTLMGSKGEETYAPSGNLFPSVFRLKHAPYTARRQGIVSLLKEEKS